MDVTLPIETNMAFPILGPGSLDAARVAVAVRMQDATGTKYLEFHRRLLGARGAVNREQALAAARDVGVDMARLERDITGDEVDKSLDESRALARALGLNGTRGYVVGKQVVMGAVGLTALGDQIRLARK